MDESRGDEQKQDPGARGAQPTAPAKDVVAQDDARREAPTSKDKAGEPTDVSMPPKPPWWRDRLPEWVKWLLGALAALLTLAASWAGVIYSHLALEEARLQRVDAINMANDGLIEAGRARKAGVAAATAQREQDDKNFRVEQRPWLFFDGTEAAELAVGKPVPIGIKLKNFGLGPAFRVRLERVVEGAPAPTCKPEGWSTIKGSPFVGAGQSFTASIALTLRERGKRAIFDEKTETIVVYLRLTYEDQFGQRFEPTTICLYRDALTTKMALCDCWASAH